MTGGDARRAMPVLSPISPMAPKQRLLFLCAFVFLWPALLNGGAFQFRDTLSYLRAADTAVFALTGYRSGNFALGSADPVDEPAAVIPPQPGHDEAPPHLRSQAAPRLVLHGRSVYFGLFLYLGILAGSLWVPVISQAMLAGAVVIATVRHFIDPGQGARFVRWTLAAFALLAITPLPYFVGFLMPDLLVGLAVPCAALLLAGWRRERPLWRALLAAVMALAALSHASAIVILGGLGLCALLAAWRWRQRATGLAGLVLAAAALLGVVGDLAFSAATRIATGAVPLRPPFLTARLVDNDGPARRYLAERCDPARFVLCRHPLHGVVTAQIFLWSEIPGRGGFKALPPADREAVAREQAEFVTAVVRAYPIATARALGNDLVTQLGRFWLPEFVPAYSARSELLAPHRPQRSDGTARHALLMAANGAIAIVLQALTFGALALLAWSLGMRRTWSANAHQRQTATIVLLVCAGILGNDVVCAWLSGPFSRYQTRVLWALPLVTMLWLAGGPGGWRRLRGQRP